MPHVHRRDELIRSSSEFARSGVRAIALSAAVAGMLPFIGPATAFAQPVDGSGMSVIVAPPSENADPAAVAACGQFAAVLEGTSLYYGQFADALESYEHPDYSDPEISNPNVLGRTALRQGAGLALSAANTPGLAPDIAGPMRSWSLSATKLLLKMGLRTSGETLNLSVADVNTHATAVQTACAAAGTHA